MPYYTSDMMHCYNYKCISRGLCYRYWLGQKAKIYGGLVTVLNRVKEMDKCEYFLDIENY